MSPFLSFSGRGSLLALLEQLVEGGWNGLVDAGTSVAAEAMPRGLTALNRGRKKADEGAKPGSTRESRQFSQLSDLHPCSSFTGRLLRQTRKG